MLLSLMFALMTLGLAVNQVATGLALTILGVGLSGLIGARFVGERIAPAPHLYIPGLTDIPLVGRILFGEDAFVYLSLALVVGVWFFLYRTRAGLILRAVGDNHVSAHALGYPVLRIRMFAVLFGGACAGLAGAYLPLAYTPFFIPGMTAGRGWIALALVVFASWRPGRAGDRRLSVRRGDDPATACAGLGRRRSLAIDVGIALSRDRHRAGPDFACANRRLRLRPRRWGPCSCRTGRHPKRARRGAAHRGDRPPVGENGEIHEKDNSSAAAAALLATGAGLFGASAADKLKVGFIYLGPVGDFGWTYQHDPGRLAVVKEFGDKVETTFLENVSEGPDTERSIEQLARAGNKLIFTTSFGYMEPTLKVAKKYPNVHFEHATGYKRDKNMATYSARFYEGRYIQGMIAAKMSKAGVLGYIASFPIPEVDLRHQRHHARRADDQSQHQDQDHLGEHLVRSRQGSRRRQGADRPGRRHHHAAHRQPRRDAGRRGARQARLRPGFRHDQVRAQDAAHLDHRTTGAPTTSSASRPCSTANGSRRTPGAA